MKVCTKCGELRDEAEFSLKSDKDGVKKYQVWCKGCFSDYAKGWYQNNKEKHKARVYPQMQARQAPIKEWVRNLKELNPCTDCDGYHEWYNMEFDHINDDKEFNISTMISLGKTRDQIQAEMDKCELVCVMCHRKRTHSRKDNDKRYTEIPRTPRSSAEERMVSTHLVGSSNLSEGTVLTISSAGTINIFLGEKNV